MGVQVDYFYNDEIYQADEVQSWVTSGLGPTDGRYWSLAVVPELANVAVCQLLRYWWVTDNSEQFNLSVCFDVQADRQHLDSNLNPDYTIPGGILFGVKLIRAPSV